MADEAGREARPTAGRVAGLVSHLIPRLLMALLPPRPLLESIRRRCQATSVTYCRWQHLSTRPAKQDFAQITSTHLQQCWHATLSNKKLLFHSVFFPTPLLSNNLSMTGVTGLTRHQTLVKGNKVMRIILLINKMQGEFFSSPG